MSEKTHEVETGANAKLQANQGDTGELSQKKLDKVIWTKNGILRKSEKTG